MTDEEKKELEMLRKHVLELEYGLQFSKQFLCWFLDNHKREYTINVEELAGKYGHKKWYVDVKSSPPSITMRLIDMEEVEQPPHARH